MPAYFLTNTISDVANKYDMGAGHNEQSTIALAIGTGATITVDFITSEYYPNNNGETSDNGTVVIIHTLTNMNVTISAQKHRVSSTGTILASGTAAAAVTTAATNTFTNLDDPTWTTTNCSDRVMLRLTYVNSAMATSNITIGTDRNTCYALSSIDHNSGCSVLRKPSQIFFQK
jgi:hypothetical protein